MSLPGPESPREDLNPRSEGITPGPVPEAVSGSLTAPCFLNQRETSGDGHNWPGSPCLIEDELCLTCGAKTARGKRMLWNDGSPIPGSEVELTPDGHDEWCESDWAAEVGMYTPCGCAARVSTGCYPDGQRSPR